MTDLFRGADTPDSSGRACFPLRRARDMSSSALVENGRRLLLCPPLRGERGTAPSVRTTQPTSREHVRDRDEFFPRLAPRSAASHFRRVDVAQSAKLDDARARTRRSRAIKASGSPELPADGSGRSAEHGLGGRPCRSRDWCRSCRSDPACSSRRHRDPRRDRPRPPPVRRCWRERPDLSRTGTPSRGAVRRPTLRKHEAAGYRRRTDR